MLHYRLTRTLNREHHARRALDNFAAIGGSIHRVGTSTAFELLIPIKAPQRRAALYKMLERNSCGEEFELVDVYSFEGGPQYRKVLESELDSGTPRPATEPVSDKAADAGAQS
jgi:hypothetical protein